MTTFARPLVIALVCMAFTGCSAVGHGPVTALVTVDMKGPVSAGPAAGSSKVGRAEAWGILVYATGDASISAAMKNGVWHPTVVRDQAESERRVRLRPRP